MNNPITDSISKSPSTLRQLVQVDRAISELRRGRSLPITSQDTAHHNCRLIASVETIDPDVIAQFQSDTKDQIYLLITGQRAKYLGFDAPAHETIYRLTPAKKITLEELKAITDPVWTIGRTQKPQTLLADWTLTAADGSDALCVQLAKQAELLPALLVSQAQQTIGREDEWSIDIDDVLGGIAAQSRSLRIVSEAQVPLEDVELARVIAFRPNDGGVEHLAIIVGEPDLAQPVLARLHSECFTGDLLGSLRCDCGPQLRGAIAHMAQSGGGILLYLAQEGRGIGLINKLRAYQLQDNGLDTVDANLALGFEEDERNYLPAAQMLRLLKVPSVRLMTNNPKKVAALEGLGIKVAERVAHVIEANRYNEGYLFTKGTRGGHLFDLARDPKVSNEQ